MCKKSNFSIKGHATLLAHTTTLILFDQALKFFELNSIPFLLIAIPLPILVVSSFVNLNLFAIDHAYKNL